MTAPVPSDLAWLDDLERAHAAATPGPWVHNPINGVHTPVGSCVATTHRHDDAERRADAALIVAAVNAVPTLIAELRKLRAVEALHTSGVHGMCAGCGWSFPCPTRRALTAALSPESVQP